MNETSTFFTRSNKIGNSFLKNPDTRHLAGVGSGSTFSGRRSADPNLDHNEVERKTVYLSYVFL